MKQYWPKKAFKWIENGTLYVSVPFTWNLPKLKEDLMQRSFLWEKAIIGGPAISVMPDFLRGISHVETRNNFNGVLQVVNPQATRTSVGCPHSCAFCAVNIIEGEFAELEEWPDLPIVTDSNLLACSGAHFDRVMDRLERHKEVDFSSGLDVRFLNEHHAERLSRLRSSVLRFALDSQTLKEKYAQAVELLRTNGVSIGRIRSFVLIGFDSDPLECWERCEFVENMGVTVNPMWYHALDCLEWNGISEEQKQLGWNHKERTRIMGWYYARRGTNPLRK